MEDYAILADRTNGHAFATVLRMCRDVNEDREAYQIQML